MSASTDIIFSGSAKGCASVRSAPRTNAEKLRQFGECCRVRQNKANCPGRMAFCCSKRTTFSERLMALAYLKKHASQRVATSALRILQNQSRSRDRLAGLTPWLTESEEAAE